MAYEVFRKSNMISECPNLEAAHALIVAMVNVQEQPEDANNFSIRNTETDTLLNGKPWDHYQCDQCHKLHHIETLTSNGLCPGCNPPPVIIPEMPKGQGAFDF